MNLFICEANTRYLRCVREQDGFLLCFGEAVGNGIDKDRPETFRGTWIRYEASKNALTMGCDRLGTAIAYFKKGPAGELFISNRIENLIDRDSQCDWSSVQQYLASGYTIGSATLFTDISQTLPNQIISISMLGGVPSISFSERPGEHSQETDCAQLIDRIGTRLHKVMRGYDKSVLMASAGWDSRTLLLNGGENFAGAYTHGDLASREISIVKRLSGSQRIDHLFTDLKSVEFCPEMVDQMLAELGFSVFPVWFAGAKIIQEWKDAPITSGVLGELMGGHYGVMSLGSRWQKLRSSLVFLGESMLTDQRMSEALDRYSTPPQTHWFVSSVGQEMLDQMRQGTRARMHVELDREFERTGDWQRALEDFQMAHRARQYIHKQAQAASSTVGYYVPFADEELTDLVRAVPFQMRIHNKLNRIVLGRQRAELLDQPMAATLVPASYPVLLQELSRLVRVVSEKVSSQVWGSVPRLGWFNYEHLYQSNVLHDFADSLRSDIWDVPKMHKNLKINQANGIDAGSTLDMLCKLKYVDYLVGFPSTVGAQDRSAWGRLYSMA